MRSFPNNHGNDLTQRGSRFRRGGSETAGCARRARVDEGRAPAGGFAATVAETAAALGEVVATVVRKRHRIGS